MKKIQRKEKKRFLVNFDPKVFYKINVLRLFTMEEVNSISSSILIDE